LLCRAATASASSTFPRTSVGSKAQHDATALTRIAEQPEDPKLAISLADQFMFQDYYADRAPEALAKEFGPQFAVALEKVKIGSWQAPIEWLSVPSDSVTSNRPTFVLQ
jgi:hypothetical protein